MPFFQVDDKAHSNPKVMQLLETAMQGDVSGPAALGLWTAAGSFVQSAGLDGLISDTQLLRLLLNPEAVEILAGKLVEVGLWHRTGHDCEVCDPVPEGHYLFHQWFQFRYDTGKDKRLADAKSQELKTERIRAEVWARDSVDGQGQEAHCRYCGHLVKRQDRKGDKRPELDHVDPSLALGSKNIVVACAQCNRQKGRRTPEQAGLTLRDAPRPLLSPAEVEPNPSQDGRTAPSAGGSGERVETQLNVRPMDQSRIRPESDLISVDRAVHGPARALAGSGGVRPGEEGNRQGQAGRRRRRRSRGRKKTSSPQQDRDQQDQTRGRAGEPPEVLGHGQFGSPWNGWRGAPPIDPEETVCADHGLNMPCRKCEGESTQ